MNGIIAEHKASECDVESMLEDFFTATSLLERLQPVFEPEPTEVIEYVGNKRTEFYKNVIPSLARKIRKCKW